MPKINNPIIAFTAGAGLMVLSAFLILAHIKTIIEVRDVSIPIVGQIPMLERRLRALTDQIELTQLHGALRIGSQEEKVEVYALPKETDVSRLIATFEIMREALARDGVLSDMSEITMGDEIEHDDGSSSQSLSVEFTVHDDGMQTILLMVRLAGLLTVGDVLTTEEIALLVDRVEQENPSGIIALEQFLSADLLRYSEDPKAYEEQLKRSFGSTTFGNALENVLRVSLLRDVRKILQSDLGEVLQSYKLWPMQIMSLQKVSVLPGNAPKWQRLGLTVQVYSSKS